MGFAMEDGLISSFPSLGASVSSFPSVPLGVVLYWICPMSWILAYRRWNTNHPRPSWMLGLRWKHNLGPRNPRKNVQNTGNIRTWEAFSEAKEKTEVWRWSRFDDRTERAPHFHRCNRGKSRGIASFLGFPVWSMSMIIVAQTENDFNRIARTILEYLTICAQHTCRYTILNIGDDLYPICLGGSSDPRCILAGLINTHRL